MARLIKSSSTRGIRWRQARCGTSRFPKTRNSATSISPTAKPNVCAFLRETLEELTAFGDGGRMLGLFFGVHSLAVDSRGNLHMTETYEGKRLQKSVFKGVGNVPRGYQGALRPKR